MPAGASQLNPSPLGRVHRIVSLPPRRYRPALAIAWSFSVVAGLAAIGPNLRGDYDPTLTVLTLTLIAVIWYTYFSYRPANPHVPTLLRVRLLGRGAPADIDITPELNNDSPNGVSCKVTLELWADGRPIGQDDFYSGKVAKPLKPHGFQVLRRPRKEESWGRRSRRPRPGSP